MKQNDLKLNLKLNKFIGDMRLGREIEFTFDGKPYFLQPDYDAPEGVISKKTDNVFRVVLYDSENYSNPDVITVGTIEEILTYKISNDLTIKDNVDLLEITCIF